MCRIYPKIVLSIIISLCFISPSAFSQDEEPVSINLKPFHIAAFKNGVGIVRAMVELPQAEGSFRVHPLPDASMGSFWLSWDKDINLTNITATQAKTSSTVPAASLQELLEANIGKNVWLTFHEQKFTKNVYKIIDIPEPTDAPVVYPKVDQVLPPRLPNYGSIILIQSQAGENNPIIALPISDIESIAFVDDSSYELEKHNIENVIEFDAKPKENANPEKPVVYITYLANGITWIPSYVIDITEKDNALFSAKSVLMNDLMPLEDVSTELIAGFPQIQYSGKADAFSMVPIHQVIERMEERKQVEDFAVQNRMYAGASLAFATVPSMPDAPVMGEQTEDLYFYQIENVSLKKGERGYYPLFAADIPYEHLYTWDIPNYIDQNSNYRYDLIEAPQEIWHSIKLTNTGNQPWTTAPAMVMKNNRVLGQDTLLYTAPKVESKLRITQALDIQAEVNEYETNRERNALEQQRRNYDLVTVKGTIAVTNYKDETVKLEISKLLSGEVVNADGSPVINKLAAGLRSVNSTSELKWNIEIKPGLDNKLVFEYSYTVYVQG